MPNGASHNSGTPDLNRASLGRRHYPQPSLHLSAGVRHAVETIPGAALGGALLLTRTGDRLAPGWNPSPRPSSDGSKDHLRRFARGRIGAPDACGTWTRARSRIEPASHIRAIGPFAPGAGSATGLTCQVRRGRFPPSDGAGAVAPADDGGTRSAPGLPGGNGGATGKPQFKSVVVAVNVIPATSPSAGAA